MKSLKGHAWNYNNNLHSKIRRLPHKLDILFYIMRILKNNLPTIKFILNKKNYGIY